MRKKQRPGHAAGALLVGLALFVGLAWAGAAGGSAAGHRAQFLYLLPDGRQCLLGVGGVGGGLLHGAEAVPVRFRMDSATSSQV